jgi:hypothetical protein
MQPALSGSIVAAAVNVFVGYVCVVSTEALDLLFETSPYVVHQRGIASVPELAMPFDGPLYPIAERFDDVLVQDFAIKRREFLMPVHDLGRNVSW